MKENARLPLHPLHPKELYRKKKTDFEQTRSVAKSVFYFQWFSAVRSKR